MREEDLLKVFEQVNVKTGELNPNVIKAWFDTDCEDLLKWMCSSINAECYLSGQEQSEFSQLDVLSEDQLKKSIKSIETEFPGIFQTDLNLFNIDVANDTIEILEEQISDYDHQLQLNQKLNLRLSAELCKLSNEEIRHQLEEESALEECTKLSQELDKINHETYDQLVKYATFLTNYEFSEYPKFVNNVNVTEFEEKFSNIIAYFKSVTKLDTDLLEMATEKYVNTLSDLENRTFQSMISHIALQMEVEGLNSVLKFLETYNVNNILSFIDHESIQLAVESSQEQQSYMLRVIEETSAKLAEQNVNQPTLRCAEIELNLLRSKLNYLNKFREDLDKNFGHFVIMYNLYCQEKADITSSKQFFRNIANYIKKDLQDCNFRKKAMLKLISEFELFSSEPIENKFKLIKHIGAILFGNKEMSLASMVEEILPMRNNIEKLKKQHLDSHSNINIFKKLRDNIQILENFLTCGPTNQMVVIPHRLQMLLFKVDENLLEQNSCVKSLIQAAQKPKDKLQQDKLLRYQHQLWMLFVTNGEKMLSFLEQLKTNLKLSQEVH